MPMLPNSSLGILFFKALIFSFLSILTKAKSKNPFFRIVYSEFNFSYVCSRCEINSGLSL
jgi:hypothetical protein